MNTKKLLCLASMIVLVTATLGHAQSLVEAARLEKLRREKLRASGAPAKLYTDGDKSGSAGTPTAGESPAAADPAVGTAPGATGPKKKEKSADEMAADKQREWAEKVKKAQDEIKSLEDAIARNERSLASMFNITPARADMAKTVESDKKKVAALKQSLVSLEDERRRAGLPRTK